MQDMYRRKRARVKTVWGNSGNFKVTFGVHIRASHSVHTSFVMLQDDLLTGKGNQISQCMLFAGDITQLGDSEKDLETTEG